MPIEKLVKPYSHDLGGGFLVRRLLPGLAPRKGVGPFVFFDHFGPVTTRPGDSHDVRPHPHIGLATVTYLFEGAMLHRDSLGSVQRIEPGAVNWMTAGRGIVHSERTPPDLKNNEYVAHGLQLWAALPTAFEEIAPDFTHTPADAMPVWSAPGIQVRVLVGNAFGLRSPVRTYCESLYLDVAAQSGGTLVLPVSEGPRFEQAIYSVDEALQVVWCELGQQYRVGDAAAQGPVRSWRAVASCTREDSAADRRDRDPTPRAAAGAAWPPRRDAVPGPPAAGIRSA